MDQATINFLGRAILRYRKFKLTFVPQKYLITGKATSVGWANNEELRMATKRPIATWMEVFVHETCHLDQQIQRPAWSNAKEEALRRMDEWLNKKRVDHIDHHVRQVIELEWDCERRSVRKIARNKLPINLKEYAQMANAYILGYHWTLNNRKWCKKTYESSYINSCMPRKIIPLALALNPSSKLIAPFYE
jgi:hypothetical protein